jgi:hypothetical protein
MDWARASGGCNCGAVRYVLRAAPLTAYICHCHLCQKRTGAAFSFSLVVPADAVEVVKGEAQVRERIGSDGEASFSAACPSCHSRLWVERRNWGTRNLRAGTLDETTELRPAAQMWTASAQRWAIAPAILSFEGQPTDFAAVLLAGRALFGSPVERA